jgi:hypothetical protein
VAQHDSLSQRSDDAKRKSREEKLTKKLTGYLTRLQKLRETLLYGDTDLLDINKTSVDTFNKDLGEIEKGIEDERSEPYIFQCLTSVDEVVDDIENARDALRVISFILGQGAPTEKNVQSRLQQYRVCKKCLTQAIRRFDPLTKRLSCGK